MGKYISPANRPEEDGVCTVCSARGRIVRCSIKVPGWGNKAHRTCKDCMYLANIFQRYGITPLEFQDVLKRQGDRCGICGLPPEESGLVTNAEGRSRLGIDHLNGKLRGLLCRYCQAMVKHLRNNPSAFVTLEYYLRGDREHAGK